MIEKGSLSAHGLLNTLKGINDNCRRINDYGC